MHSKFFRRSGVTGAERKGVRGDIKLVYAADRPAEDVEPTVERPAALINSVRYYGDKEGTTAAEAMTATSAALFELLMSVARPALQDQKVKAGETPHPFNDRMEHKVSFEDAKSFLRIEKSSRLRTYMSALASTWVSYDFLDLADGYRRIGSRIQLMQCEEIVSTTTGERFISYSMHPSVAKVIRGDGIYAYLELGAFPEFSSKYTSRLYPKLALMAGRELRPPMTWTPEELAEELGWKTNGPLKFSNFENRVLKPVLADIEQHVRRFSVQCSYVKADTRGKPVAKIILTVGPATKAPSEYPKAKMSKLARHQVADIAARGALSSSQVPGEDIIRRAATRLEMPTTEIMTLWRTAFVDEGIIAEIESDGVSKVFERWVQQQKREIPEDGVSFEDAAVVRLIVVPEFELRSLTKQLLTPLSTRKWTGTEAKILRVEWTEDGSTAHRDYETTATETDVARLISTYTDIIEDMEYAA